MKITIDTNILKKYNLTLGEFLVLLIGYKGLSYTKSCESLKEKDLIQPDLFEHTNIVLSNNTKNLVSKIITESSIMLTSVNIDFEDLAAKLMDLYPSGNKSGTTYPWRGNIEEIAQKLRTLVAIYNFQFTEEEAIDATKEYLSSISEFDKFTLLLKNFILNVKTDESGNKEINSLFMTIIENRRKEESE